MIGILNAAMFGTPREIGEHVDWSAPDVASEAHWSDLLGTDVATYAAENTHMIVFEVASVFLPNRERCPACRTTGTVHHEPDSDICRLIAEERRRSQSDWQCDS